MERGSVKIEFWISRSVAFEPGVQIPPDRLRIGMIGLCTAEATASWSTFEGTLQLLWQDLPRMQLAAEYSQNTLTEDTPTCSNYSDTVLYETYAARQKESPQVVGQGIYHVIEVLLSVLEYSIPWSWWYQCCLFRREYQRTPYHGLSWNLPCDSVQNPMVITMWYYLDWLESGCGNLESAHTEKLSEKCIVGRPEYHLSINMIKTNFTIYPIHNP